MIDLDAAASARERVVERNRREFLRASASAVRAAVSVLDDVSIAGALRDAYLGESVGEKIVRARALREGLG